MQFSDATAEVQVPQKQESKRVLSDETGEVLIPMRDISESSIDRSQLNEFINQAISAFWDDVMAEIKVTDDVVRVDERHKIEERMRESLRLNIINAASAFFEEARKFGLKNIADIIYYYRKIFDIKRTYASQKKRDEGFCDPFFTLIRDKKFDDYNVLLLKLIKYIKIKTGSDEDIPDILLASLDFVDISSTSKVHDELNKDADTLLRKSYPRQKMHNESGELIDETDAQYKNRLYKLNNIKSDELQDLYLQRLVDVGVMLYETEQELKQTYKNREKLIREGKLTEALAYYYDFEKSGESLNVRKQINDRGVEELLSIVGKKGPDNKGPGDNDLIRRFQIYKDSIENPESGWAYFDAKIRNEIRNIKTGEELIQVLERELPNDPKILQPMLRFYASNHSNKADLLSTVKRKWQEYYRKGLNLDVNRKFDNDYLFNMGLPEFGIDAKFIELALSEHIKTASSLDEFNTVIENYYPTIRMMMYDPELRVGKEISQLKDLTEEKDLISASKLKNLIIKSKEYNDFSGIPEKFGLRNKIRDLIAREKLEKLRKEIQ